MKRSLPVCLQALLCMCITEISVGQSLRISVSNPYLSLSAYSNKQASPFSFTGNQAALMRVKSAEIGVYGERRFLSADDPMYSLAAVFPSKQGNFGVQVNYAGFKNFNEQAAGLAYARSLGSKADAGVQFNYYGYRVPGYGNASAVYFEGGFIVHLSEKISTGIHIYNPIGGKTNKQTGEKIASVYTLGLGYDASPELYIGTEITREENQPVNVTAGIQYRFKKQFFFCGGFRGDNSTGFAGAGFLYKNLRTDITLSFHPQLGISPGVLLIYQFKKEQL